jgi:hypothetical protein
VLLVVPAAEMSKVMVCVALAVPTGSTGPVTTVRVLVAFAAV